MWKFESPHLILSACGLSCFAPNRSKNDETVKAVLKLEIGGIGGRLLDTDWARSIRLQSQKNWQDHDHRSQLGPWTLSHPKSRAL